MSLELKRIIDQVSKEKGVDKKLLISALEDAIRSAIKKKSGAAVDMEIAFNDETGEIEAFQYRTVVAKVFDPELEISLDEAKKMDPESAIGDSLGIKLDVAAMGRIAAQSARQVIMQKMKSAERDIIYEEFKDRVDKIITGNVQRFEKNAVILNLGKTEAILPASEQLPNENMRRGDTVRAYVTEVRKSSKEPQIVISRAHPSFLAKLFELESPEIADGTVKIMGVAREPGSRSKIAVSSTNSDVDPVGACVGMRGSRVQAVVQELRGEKIDIVPWSPDPARYIYNALAPAECSRVIVDEANQSLEVIVPDDQLSLAIGKNGQNVRLAAKLLRWKIDVKTESRAAHLEDPDFHTLLEIPNMTESVADRLYEIGIKSKALLAEADPTVLVQQAHIKRDLARAMIESAQNETMSISGEAEG